MRVTQSFTLGTDYWWPMGPINRIEMLQVRGDKMLRLHFRDAQLAGADIDEDDYILTTGYDPRPITFDPSRAGSDTEVMYAKVDGDDPVPCVMVFNNDDFMLDPPSGTLANGTVGKPYSMTFHTTPTYTSTPNFSKLSGTLPPGLTLSAAGVLSGTPTTAGQYFFEAVIPQAGNSQLGYGIYSLAVVAAS